MNNKTNKEVSKIAPSIILDWECGSIERCKTYARSSSTICFSTPLSDSSLMSKNIYPVSDPIWKVIRTNHLVICRDSAIFQFAKRSQIIVLFFLYNLIFTNGQRVENMFHGRVPKRLFLIESSREEEIGDLTKSVIRIR